MTLSPRELVTLPGSPFTALDCPACSLLSQLLTTGAFVGLFLKEERTFGGLFPKEERCRFQILLWPREVARPKMTSLCRVKAAFRTSLFLDEVRMWQLREESIRPAYPGLPPSGQAPEWQQVLCSAETMPSEPVGFSLGLGDVQSVKHLK